MRLYSVLHALKNFGAFVDLCYCVDLRYAWSRVCRGFCRMHPHLMKVGVGNVSHNP